jgi:Flp pilus assembly protein TadG
MPACRIGQNSLHHGECAVNIGRTPQAIRATFNFASLPGPVRRKTMCGQINHLGKIGVTIEQRPIASMDKGNTARTTLAPCRNRRLKPSALLAKWLRAFARDQGAVGAVEFAMLALPLFAIIFAALQTAIVLMAEQELQTAVEEASRLVMTGQVTSTTGQSTTMTQAQFTNKVCSYLVSLFNCANLMVNMQTTDSFADASTTAPSYTTLQQNQWSFQSGSAGSVVVIQVMYEWPIIGAPLGFNLATLPNGTRLMMGTAVFQNEPDL